MYVFGMPFTNDTLPADGMRFAQDEAELSFRMIKSWSQFAHTGNPGWSKFELENKIVKEFNSKDSLKSANDDYFKARINFIKSNL